MPNTVPAADTGLPNLSRRSALAKLGLGLAASTSLAATAIAAAPAGVSPELSRLIEAHKATYDAVQEAERQREEAEQVYSAMKPEAPSLYEMYDDGPREEKKLEMSLGLAECKQRVLENLDFKRRFVARGFEDYASPRRLKQLKAAHRAIEKDTLASVEAFFVKDEAARQSSGLATAELDRRHASAAEGEAMTALCSYRCTTIAETRLKGGYLSSNPLGVDALTVENMKALLQSSRAEG
jgi:hypothetical protein